MPLPTPQDVRRLITNSKRKLHHPKKCTQNLPKNPSCTSHPLFCSFYPAMSFFWSRIAAVLGLFVSKNFGNGKECFHVLFQYIPFIDSATPFNHLRSSYIHRSSFFTSLFLFLYSSSHLSFIIFVLEFNIFCLKLFICSINDHVP